MRKMALAAALWFFLSAWFGTALPAGLETENHSASVATAAFVLPASLKEIGEGAFENTAAVTVIISDATEIIGNRAFANNSNLENVHIPRSVIFIGEYAFTGSPSLTIIGIKDSYAAAWAQIHNIAFRQEDCSFNWPDKLGDLFRGNLLLTFCLSLVSPGVQYWQRKKTEYAEKSMRPQDRSELYPIDYRFP